MDKFIETYSLPRLNHEERENLNRPISVNSIESIIKNLPKVQDWMVSLVNYTKNLKKNQYHPSNSSKIEGKVTLLNSFHEGITLIPKLDKDIMRKL